MFLFLLASFGRFIYCVRVCGSLSEMIVGVNFTISVAKFAFWNVALRNKLRGGFSSRGHESRPALKKKMESQKKPEYKKFYTKQKKLHVIITPTHHFVFHL